MLLSARILTNVGSVNVYEYADVAEFTEGDAPTIYFQLIDASQDRTCRPPGRRFMPASGATLQCVVHHIDDAKKITRFATQPYASDPSIWKLVLTTADQTRGTADLLLTLTEGSVVTRGRASSCISASSQVQGY